MLLRRLSRSLHQHFPANGSGTWILLRHGLKARSIKIVDHEFRKGWDDFRRAHMLQADQMLVLACERKWIFHTVMFDERGLELVFDWLGPNAVVAGMICPLLRMVYKQLACHHL